MSDMQASKGRQQVAGAPGHAFPFLKAGMRVSARGRGEPGSHHGGPTHPAHPTNPHAEPHRDPTVRAGTKRPQPLHQRGSGGDRGEQRRVGRGGSGGVFVVSKRTAGPCRLPPGSHLLSPPALLREPRLLASIPGRFFLLVSAKLPLSEGWRASIIESKERKQIKKKKQNKTASHPPPLLLPPLRSPNGCGGPTPPRATAPPDRL